MKNLKKIISLLITGALLLASFTVMAEEAPSERGGVSFGGYAVHDFANSADSKFITFSGSDPALYETQSFCLTTYAAAYYDGAVYGYVYGYDQSGALNCEFYAVDTMNGHIINFPGGSSDGEFVFAMAYDYTRSTMYALCNEDHPYIASVDLATGALTRVVDIDLGSYLGLMCMAIDSMGNFYALTMSALNSRLLSLDIETGALTEIGATGHPAYYAQSMTCDPATDTLYWAELNSATDNGLYAVDPQTAECTFMGKIGPEGMEIAGLYVVYDEPPVPDFTPGDADCNGIVNMQDALLALRSSIGICQLSELGELQADVNGDGGVTIADALSIMRYCMGLEG